MLFSAYYPPAAYNWPPSTDVQLTVLQAVSYRPFARDLRLVFQTCSQVSTSPRRSRARPSFVSKVALSPGECGSDYDMTGSCTSESTLTACSRCDFYRDELEARNRVIRELTEKAPFWGVQIVWFNGLLREDGLDWVGVAADRAAWREISAAFATASRGSPLRATPASVCSKIDGPLGTLWP